MKNLISRHMLLFFSFVICISITLPTNLQAAHAAESADSKSPGSQVQSRETILTPEEPLLYSKKILYGIIGTVGLIMLIASVTLAWNRRLRKEIKKREKAEAALRDSEEQFRNLVETSQDLIWKCDSEGRFTYLNSAWETVVGYKVDEMLNRHFTEFKPPEIVRRDAETFKKILKGSDTFGYETIYISRSGERKYLVFNARFLKDDDGNVIGTQGTAHDITDRKKTEAQIQEAHQRVLTIMDSIDALIYVSDMDTYELLFVNKYGRDVWGDIIGKTCWSELQEGQPGPCEFCSNKYLLDPGGQPKGVYIWEFQNTVNKHWYYIQDKAIRWIDGRIVRLEIATDITDRKRAEEERERLNKELEQIISVISHDLRSPIVNIDGYSKDMEISAKELNSALQRKDVPKDIKEKVDSIVNEDMSESAKYISASIYKMDSLLNGLLKLSRTGQVELENEKLDMNGLVSYIADNFEFQTKEAGANIKISKLPPCAGDRSQVDQVFSNLIGNALKYLDPERSGIITVSGNKEKDRIVYCVEDNGVGIAPENQEKIFGIFKQLNRESTGEGLGLAIVKRIVERHNGSIRVESEPGRGSRFFISLPA